jgi:glycerol-3-phosphate O-acyltransferase
MRKQDRERTLIEVSNRVLAHVTAQGDAAVERYLADAVFHEKRRLDQEKPTPQNEAQRAFWRDIQSRLIDASPEEQRRMLHRAIQAHTEEIIGRFDPRVYALATRAIPPALTFLLNRATPREVLQQFPEGVPQLQQNVVIQGHTTSLQRLHDRGRIILVPTHLSHLDSIAVGYVLYELGLPPFAYGAGLNLFTNPMLSFFMHNLGAYKVDRKKKHDLYKDVLKEYCTFSLEIGYDNLFFPGGTRGRSGAVESHLKLGLLGCGLRAYQNNLRADRQQPRVFIVPATLSYHLVLEAETLIDDFLQEVGKARYIIEDDESTQPKRVYQFVRNLLTLNGRIYCTIGRPLDPFGNDVDDEGVSRDARGRPIDISKYVTERGVLKEDDQRDHEYTRMLGDRITDSFHRENVILSTHLLARALWDLLRDANPGMDLYRLLRTGGRQPSFAQAEVADRVERLTARVEALAFQAKVRIDPRLNGVDARGMMDEALKHFSSYHTTPVAVSRGERIFPENLNLLLYYQNRLQGYEL